MANLDHAESPYLDASGRSQNTIDQKGSCANVDISPFDPAEAPTPSKRASNDNDRIQSHIFDNKILLDPHELFYLEYQRYSEPENRHFLKAAHLVHSCTAFGANPERSIPFIRISIITGVLYEELKKHLFPKGKSGGLKVSWPKTELRLCKYDPDGSIRTKWMLRQPLPVAIDSHLCLVDTQTGEPLMPATQHTIWIRHDGLYPIASECRPT